MAYVRFIFAIVHSSSFVHILLSLLAPSYETPEAYDNVTQFEASYTEEQVRFFTDYSTVFLFIIFIQFEPSLTD
jgi:hypothetical protein